MEELTKDVVKEVAKDAYEDMGRPIAKPTGELVGLVPRAIKAALAPLEKWILAREFNVAETRKLLEEKLKDIPPENITSPEPYVAVPALQYISYCMDNHELRNMYASLLAASMNERAKNGVHPSFVEVIKQLSPDEAKILSYMTKCKALPTISVRFENEKGEGIPFINDFSNVDEIVGCERKHETGKYFDNLERLGLIKRAPSYSVLTTESRYQPLIEDEFIKSAEAAKEIVSHIIENPKFKIVKSFVSISDYGRAFCIVCLPNE